METKQYLMQISRLDRKINNKLSEIAQYKELAQSISAVENKERVQTSPDFDKIGGAIAKLDEMERKLDKMIDEYVEKKTKIIEQIDKMDDEIHYQILFSRYIEKKTFEKIATEINYSFRNTTRLHGKALKEFEKIYGHLYLNL